MIYYIGIIIMAILGIFLNAYHSKDALHMMQLEGYRNSQFWPWVKKNKKRAFVPMVERGEVKKPLVMTDRAKRLHSTTIGIDAVLIAIFVTIFVLVTGRPIPYANLLVGLFVFIAVLYIAQPFVIMLANLIMKPVEQNINDGFFRAAQKKLKHQKETKVVGITGSYGKTSTKFITTTILKGKFKAMTTPSSYNTPMGISKVINNDLDGDTEVFVVEMGARHEGDIAELTELTSPEIGVLTSVGPAHLETFGDIETIMDTKYELIESLPTNGIAIFNYDNSYVKSLADKTFKKKYLYGTEYNEKLDIYADHIEVYELGTSFNLHDKNGNTVECHTKLLGKHNISNILAGVCVGLALGMTLEEVAEEIPKIEPVPHRLSIINPGTGIIIIDDAFNSNPSGAKAALDVLDQFKNGKKIIVTPGMVELGEEEEKENHEFGQNIGKVCDIAILVGEKRTEPIYNGIKKSKFNEKNIHVVNNLSEASEKIAELAKPGDIILFENDLPDTYNE